MALVKTKDTSVDLPDPRAVAKLQKKKQKVLDEETYTEGVEKIIEQDFFPDLPKLQAQTEYFEALENNDLVKLREIQIKYSKTRPDTDAKSVYFTPATFETPEHHSKSPSRPEQSDKELPDKSDDKPKGNIDKSGKKVHLDKFLSENTSEDNASFAEILEETQKKHREKHAWLFENEQSRKEEETERLALPSIESQAAITDGQAGVDTWKYTTRNSLMYVPDGAEHSSQELVEMMKKKPREIIHENTRFKLTPWDDRKNKEKLKTAASEKAMIHSGKIGHDGKEILPLPSPRVNGYGFVATPSPAPGVEESPLMTWGEIEGTPFSLDGGATPVPANSGPSFKMPAVPKRDRLALELAEKASKAHRDKKEKALKIASRLASPAPKFGISTTDRISSMSPAAQKLVNSRLGNRTHTDKALRESYTPSPSHRLPGDKTPIVSPRGTPKSNRTPSLRTPGSKREGEATPSLTDDLLQIPKRKKDDLTQVPKERQKASDFF